MFGPSGENRTHGLLNPIVLLSKTQCTIRYCLDAVSLNFKCIIPFCFIGCQDVSFLLWSNCGQTTPTNDFSPPAKLHRAISIHNHIIYNSTALDGTRKFKNFWLSTFAVQRLSNLICLEHQLSTIEYKPYRERQKRIVYPPRGSNRDRLCGIIDTILAEQPKDFEVFLQKLEQQGYEVKRGKHTAVKGKGQKRFIRFRTLGTGYGEDEIKAVLEGKAKHKPYQKKPPQEQSFQLLVDRRKHCLLALRTVKLPFQSSRVIFLGRSPAEEHLPGIIQAKECMKKKKPISEEQHYLCEIGLEKMPYGSSWLYKSYTEESLTHITITAAPCKVPALP